MDIDMMFKDKISKKIEKYKEVIAKCESGQENVPEDQREIQKIILELMKKDCEKLEMMNVE